MERETKEITTQNGTTITYNAYLTGKEARELQAAFMGQTEVEATDNPADKPKVKFKAGVLMEIQGMAIKFLAVAVNGNKDNAADAVDNLPAPDYAEVVKAFNPILTPVFDPSFLGQ